MVRKGFGIRLLALIIDFLILAVIQVVLSLIILGTLRVSFGTVGSASDPAMAGRFRILQIVAGIVGLAYWSLEIVQARSVGKMLLGMTIGSENGVTPAAPSALGTRYLLKQSPTIMNVIVAILGVSFLSLISTLVGLAFFIGCFFALGAKRQALHDMIAHTAVYGPGTEPVIQQGFEPIMGGTGVPPPPPL